MKVHTTAVVLIPPEEDWEPIQCIRQHYDSKIDRWMPHITLLYPFVPVDQFAAAEDVLRSAVSSISPFMLTLSEIGRFSHGRKNFTFWLGPDDPAPLVRLQSALFQGFPECDDQNRGGKTFNPHLTVARGRGKKAGDELFEELKAIWEPIHFPVESIAMIAREAETPFEVKRIIKLEAANSLTSS